MLFSLLVSLIEQYSFLNVFKYLTFRTGLSVITSLIIVFIIGGPLIKLFSEKMITGPIRQDGPIDHIIKKSGTPTMGGVIIIIGILFSTLLWADLANTYVWTLIFVSLSLGALGLLDDILKIKYRNSRGLKSSYKFLGQVLISIITLVILINYSNHEFLYNLYFPFFKNLIWDMGWFFIAFGLFVIIGSSNAVNLTDGLDGLATVPVMLVAISFYINFICCRQYYLFRIFTDSVHRRCWGTIYFLRFCCWSLLRFFFGIMLLLQKFLWEIQVHFH